MSKVYIIGTGPGDEELLTLKAVNSLKQCTAVLYDRLVSNNILNYIDEDCKIYYCGKEPGIHYKTQDQINELMVSLAKAGHTVGRIKGGDPYVFGRGGEEVLALKKENIQFEVIPGVTSPIAVLNYAGIPITHRGVSQSFHIVTGKSAASLKINFEALAKENGTLVFMMGLSSLDSIVENLLRYGKNIDTPCAVVMRGTCSKQKKVIGTLKDIKYKVEKAKLKSPCIIVVGEVVKLNENLNWYENKPLFGRNIALLRTLEQGKSLKEKLKALGAEVTSIPAIEIKNTCSNMDKYINKLSEYNHIAFTSVNSVNIFFDYLIEKEYDIRNIKAEISCVGKSTTEALKRRGVFAAITADIFSGKGLSEKLKDIVKKGDKVLIPCSSLSKNTLMDELLKGGAEVDRVHIYDTVCPKLKDIKSFDETDIVLFTSPSTAKNIIKMCGIDKVKEKVCVAIGETTNRCLKDYNIDAVVCSNQSDDGFIEKLYEMYIKDN